LNNKKLSKLFKNLEVVSVVCLLLCAESVSLEVVKTNIANIITYGIIFFLIVGRLKRFAYVAMLDVSFVLLCLIAITSLFWSENPSATFTHIRAAVRSVLFGVYLAMQYTPAQLMRLLSWVTGIAIFLSFVVCLLMPSYGITDGFWMGIFTHKQVIGRFMSFAASIFLVNALSESNNNRWLTFLVLALAVTLILLSQSKTGLLALGALVLLLPFNKIVKQNKARALLMIVGLLLYSVVAMLLSMNLETIVVNVLGKNLEFNGRMPIWTLAIAKGLERPILGYGYYGFWTSKVSDDVLHNVWAGLNYEFANRIIIFHSHNGFVDIFLQFGLVGLALVAFNLLSVIFRVTKLFIMTRKIEFFWMLNFLAIYLVYNFGESETILSTTNILWITFTAITLSSQLEMNRIKSGLQISNSTIYQKQTRLRELT
jgi:exopolysaccharide production protein ExoQ